MVRALRLLALFSTFFVVAVRCLGGFPLLVACASSLADAASSQVCPASEQPADRDSLAPIALDDDSDDGAEPVLAPAPLELSALTYGECASVSCGAIDAQRRLPSHAPSLERPPRG